ncbi:MAG: aldose 1-epimerase family protein [Lachnospiraceae bacterium]|nr:aldose 1-epimerase family protein [Lachnospiraceae bacterium]
MLYSIENEFVKATFASKGAELQSFILKADNTEYIWQANPTVWGKHAPLLFPIIGRLKDGEYTFEGQAYQTTQHGFGRDSEFEVLKQTKDSITFILKPNEFSVKMYPFAFELQICYSLEGHSLSKAHTFINKDSKTLYYEVGGHDGYNICLEEGEVMEDYYIDFGDLDAIYPLCLDENILILKDTYKVPLADGKLLLNMDLFKKDALMIHNIPVRTVRIKSRKSNREITFAFEDFPTLGIWTKYLDFNTNYICLEPWSTLPDCAYLGKEIEEKIDIRKVAAGRQETLKFTVTIQ